MKKLIEMVVVLVLLLVAGCTDMTASIWDGRDDAIGGRIGYVMGNTEVGGSVLHWPETKNAEIFGVYGLYKFPDLVEIPNPLKLDFLPETIMGTPYLGGKVDSDGGETLLMGGIEIANTLFMEYQNQYLLVGLKHKF